MNQELLINLGNGTQTVREAEQLETRAFEATGLFLSVLLRGIWVSTWYLSVTQERAGSRNIRTRKRNQEAGGESDVLIQMFDLSIGNTSNEPRVGLPALQLGRRAALIVTPLSFMGHIAEILPHTQIRAVIVASGMNKINRHVCAWSQGLEVIARNKEAVDMWKRSRDGGG